ncbi:hypothetical protein [uncultured Clostridium sp.]|uniref:hypothetical protein n=1 Tax=uncultured Clostridium sp. TaxID=59620 RepID=UPI0028EF2660|nr:hypothetical protein [uncultured Clostridium sp.]
MDLTMDLDLMDLMDLTDVVDVVDVADVVDVVDVVDITDAVLANDRLIIPYTKKVIMKLKAISKII